MITIKIELWPHGDEKRRKEIGRMYIANVGGDAQRGEYDVAVCRRGTVSVPKPLDPEGPSPTRQGHVSNYPRLAYNVWRLITRALLSAFPEERPLSTAERARAEREAKLHAIGFEEPTDEQRKANLALSIALEEID